MTLTRATRTNTRDRAPHRGSAAADAAGGAAAGHCDPNLASFPHDGARVRIADSEDSGARLAPPARAATCWLSKPQSGRRDPVETLDKLAAFRTGKWKIELWILMSPAMIAMGVAGTNGAAFAARIPMRMPSCMPIYDMVFATDHPVGEMFDSDPAHVQPGLTSRASRGSHDPAQPGTPAGLHERPAGVLAVVSAATWRTS